MVWGSIRKFFASRYGPIIDEQRQEKAHILEEAPLLRPATTLSQELQELKMAIEQEKERTLTGLMTLDTKLKVQRDDLDSISFSLHRAHQTIDDLKLGTKLTLETHEKTGLLEKRIHDIENRLRDIESTFSKRLVNLSELNNQHSLNFTQPEPSLRVGSPTYENQQQETLNLEMFTKRLVNLARLTRTEKAVLMALYELQADIAERAVPAKELVEKIYGKRAKHSKLVYISKLTKDMVGKGALQKIESGPTPKLFLAPETIEISSHLVAQKHG